MNAASHLTNSQLYPPSNAFLINFPAVSQRAWGWRIACSLSPLPFSQPLCLYCWTDGWMGGWVSGCALGCAMGGVGYGWVAGWLVWEFASMIG